MFYIGYTSHSGVHLPKSKRAQISAEIAPLATVKRAVSIKEQPRVTLCLFLRWHSTRVFQDVVISWPHLTATITASRLGPKHAEAAFVDDSFSLREHDHRVPSAIPCSGLSAQQRTTSVKTQGDLRTIVGALPLGQSSWTSRSSHILQAVEFPDESAGP